MNDSEIKRKISKIVIASRRSLDPSFRQYWKDAATKLATKHQINLSEIENSSEFNIEIKATRYY
jgi:ABC-type phosphate/phosphonate transport system substrate-binding protein